MNMLKQICAILFLFFLYLSAFSQNGIIRGLVTDAKNSDPLPFVNISTKVGDDLIGAQTDFDGNFKIELPEGTHKINFSFMGYEARDITQYIGAGESITLNVELGTSSTLLETVVISEGKYEKPLSKVTVSMAVLKPATIGSANDTEISQSIERVPGVDVVDGQANIRGGSGYSYGAGSRVMLLMDGLPVLTADSGFPNWDFLPVENVSQIEIIKGAASALYGSAAMNGIINLRTGYPTDEPETKVSLFSGMWQNPRNNNTGIFKYLDEDGKDIKYNYNDEVLTAFSNSPELTQNAIDKITDSLGIQKNWWKGRFPVESGISLSHKQKFKHLDLVLGSYLYSSEGFRQNQHSKRGRVSANLRFRPNVEGLTFGINANFMRNTSVSFLIWDFEPDNSSANYNPVGTYQLWRSTPPINNNGLKLTVDPYIEYFNNNGWRFKWLNRFFKNNNITDTGQSTISDFYYSELQAQKRFDDINFTITTGLVGSLANSKSELFNDPLIIEAKGDSLISASNIAAYVQLDKELWENLNISVGARYERNAIDEFTLSNNGAPTIVKTPDAEPVFRAGINYQAAEATYIRASFGQAYRFPTIAEKYIQTNLGSIRGFDIGIFPNPNLAPETGWSAEIGVKQGFKISEWEGFFDVTGFINEYQDMMEFSFGTSPDLEGLLRILYPDWDYASAVALEGPAEVGFQSINIGSTRIIGGDFSLAGQGKLFGLPTRALLGYTYINPQHKNFDTLQLKLSSADYNILKYRFQHTFKLDAESTIKKLAIGTSMRYYSFMEAIDESFNWILPGVKAFREEHNGGTFVWDARIRYNFTAKSSLAFISKNILNKEYALRPALINAPRSYTIRYNHEF